jgi:hypothetical protein
MPAKVHLIEKNGRFKKIAGQAHESGFWTVTPQKADSLIGGDIYFHKKQTEPSFFGGRITGYRIHEVNDEFYGKIIFCFEYSPAHRNISAGKGGWGNEIKFA